MRCKVKLFFPIEQNHSHKIYTLTYKMNNLTVSFKLLFGIMEDKRAMGAMSGRHIIIIILEGTINNILKGK